MKDITAEKPLTPENLEMMQDIQEESKEFPKKRVQDKPVDQSKKRIDLGLLKAEQNYNSDSVQSNSEDNLEESVEYSVEGKKEEHKTEHKFSMKEVKGLISDSDFRNMLEIKTEPCSSGKILKKTILTFDMVSVISNSVNREICKGMNIILKNATFGKLRQIRDIELQLEDQKLLGVIIQTEIYITKEDIAMESSENWLQCLKQSLKNEQLGQNEVIKVVEVNVTTTAIPFKSILENFDDLGNVQLCNSADEVKMKEKLNSEARVFFCNRQFFVDQKRLVTLDESMGEKDYSVISESEHENVQRKVEANIDVLPERANQGKDAMLAIYDKGCRNLELNALPEYLPCREKEHAEIYDFIKMGIEAGGSATSLYISGMPGTGKTATVLEVIKRLKKDVEKGVVPTFEFVNINSMSIGSIYMVYCTIYKNFTEKHASPGQAILFLDKYFKRKKIEAKGVKNPEIVRVILIDELDGLFTKKQDLIYNLFDWPSYAQARLVMIGIANTMNLPEELQGKIASRIGCKRLVYEPYNKDQIQIILNTRISKLDLFELEAVRYVSTKVAALSGDMRRCLQISKRSVELVRKAYLDSPSNEPIKVRIAHLVVAGKELFNSKITALIRCLTDYEVLILTALVLERTHAKIDIIKKAKLYSRVEQVISKVEAKNLKRTEIDYIVIKLGEFGLIVLDDTKMKKQMNETITVHVFNDELITALEEKQEYRGLIELIQNAF